MPTPLFATVQYEFEIKPIQIVFKLTTTATSGLTENIRCTILHNLQKKEKEKKRKKLEIWVYNDGFSNIFIFGFDHWIKASSKNTE